VDYVRPLALTLVCLAVALSGCSMLSSSSDELEGLQFEVDYLRDELGSLRAEVDLLAQMRNIALPEWETVREVTVSEATTSSLSTIPEPSSVVQVLVANGSGTSRAAGPVAELLKSKGYATLAVANARPTDSTMIFFRPGMMAEARAVMEILAPDSPGLLAQIPPTGLAVAENALDRVEAADIVVILGTDGRIHEPATSSQCGRLDDPTCVSLFQETSCRVLEDGYRSAKAIRDAASDVYGWMSEPWQIAEDYRSAVSSRMNQLNC